MNDRNGVERTMRRASWVLGLLCGLASGAWADLPTLMTYQGRLKESGLPVTGIRAVRMSVCTQLSGGSCIQEPASQNVAVLNGVFRTTFTISGWDPLSYQYLNVNVGSFDLSPREQLTAAPYALAASSAAALVAGSSNTFGVNITTHVFFSAGSPPFAWKIKSADISGFTGPSLELAASSVTAGAFNGGNVFINGGSSSGGGPGFIGLSPGVGSVGSVGFVQIGGNIPAAHLRATQTVTPTVSFPGGNCGTITASNATGTDMAGLITFTSSSAGAAACTVQLSFARGYAAAPKSVVVTAANAGTGLVGGTGLGWYVDNGTVGSGNFQIKMNAAPVAGTYVWYYMVIE